jgi:hypothetical protein
LALLLSPKNAIAQTVEVPQVELTIQEYAKQEVVEKWSEEEWYAFDLVIKKESGWTHNTAHNPKLSSAYGLGGFLDSTWSSVGCVKTSDMRTQIDCTIKYIEKNYQEPSTALKVHNKQNWY